MRLRRPPIGSRGEQQHSAPEHLADPTVAGGSHDLMAAHARPHPRGSQQLSRFRWGVAALFSLAVCSLAAAVVLSTGGRRSGSSPAAASGGSWSSWAPPDNGLAGAQEIADFVAPNYRATPGNQLAVVTVVNLNDPAAPVQVIVPASTSGSELPLPASSTVVYNLCGEGSSNCSIGVGKPSAARLLLLRREALELALYTFKYISGSEAIVALLPPGYTTSQCSTSVCAKSREKTVTKPLNLAVAFDRTELSPWLRRPLRATLPGSLPPSVSQMEKAPEAELVSVITSHGLFSANTAAGQDGSTVITLSPLSPQ